MPPIDTLIAFFAATAIFAYMPGPAMLYTAAQTIARGKRAGAMAALGIHLGGYVHVVAAAAGLAVLFHAVPVLYMVLKLVGAAYLIWLGIKLIREASVHTVVTVGETKTARRAFFESVTVEVLNPKTALFFLAFLPQFVDPTASLAVWMQLLILGTVVNLMFSSADLVCIALAGAVVQRLRQSSVIEGLTKRIGGTLLIGLGAHMAWQRS